MRFLKVVCSFALFISCSSVAFATPITISPTPISFSSGQTFSVDAVVTNINDLYAFQFDWKFDPSLLTAVSVSEGPFLSSGGGTFFISGTIDNVNSVIANTADTLIGQIPGVSGSGILAMATFMAKSSGTATITSANPILLDSQLNPITSSTPVPEPSSFALLGTGLAALCVIWIARCRGPVSVGEGTGRLQTLISRATIFLLGVVLLFCVAPARAQTPPSPPFKQCQPAGLNTGCRILIWIDATGSLRVLTDPSAALAYDGIEDTLIGVLNQSSKSIASIPLKGPNTIFDFDQDGICEAGVTTPTPAGCPFGPTGYEGPGVSFSFISGDKTSGTVNFSPPIPANGGTAYFGLELAIQTQCTAITPPAPLNQGDPRWASTILGHSNQTIGAYGCFLTDLAMEINYYAQRQGQTFRTDPQKLNAYLTAKGAFDSTGNLSWSNVPLVTKYAGDNGVRMYYGGLIDHRDDFTLDQYICSGFPPMLYVGNPHWVFATGQATSPGGKATYSDIDPDSWPNGNTLDNSNWNNTYNAMLLFTDIVGPLQGLYVTGHSPIEFVMTDPAGAQTGFNPVTKTRLHSIPSSGYMINQLASDVNHGAPLTPPLKELSIIGAADGTYKLQSFGTGNGPYTIDVTYYDNAGNGPFTKTISGTAYPGVTSTFAIQYSGAAGAPVTVTSFCAGDVNGDSVVDSADLSIVKGDFGAQTGSTKYNVAADVNHDGIINLVDLAYVSQHVGCRTTTQ